ncbi:xanthine dehydrogenase accessory protein XdhC [Ruegeria hyattellae]|uniref:xanthine dehydrogenase accessory protein XdhC n=1 Tax=Ruegeria hyattellae TaxID=3233337 RepID=UPI00355C9B63
MGFELETLRAAVAEYGRVVRVVIASIRGSSPREVGTAMLVWEGGQSGTIGGGTLEFQAAQAARQQTQPRLLSQHALGPDLGQCCGGAVNLLSEVYDASALNELTGDVIVRPVEATEMPLSVKRLLAARRGQGLAPEPQLIDGWMIEPIHNPARALWIWGAGHVGRALVDVLAPLPDLAITWVDTGAERFPESVPDGVTVVPAAKPADLVSYAPTTAEHLVLTYSHVLDLDLCDQLLRHEFAFAGLIGSATKWARFRSRLSVLGHAPERIARITCPIGDPALGKHPQLIAVGVAAQLLRPHKALENKKDLSA